MLDKRYKVQLEKLSTKIDKNSSLAEAILYVQQHNMFIERGIVAEDFKESFERMKNDVVLFEKVDLLDYWNWENDRGN